MSGAAPYITGPKDLPDLRAWMVRQWEDEAGWALASAFSLQGLPARVSVPEAALQVARWNRNGLRDATLWYVTADMVDLIEASAESLPEVALEYEQLPNLEPHFVYFERPLQGTDAVTPGQTVLVDALMWTDSAIPAYYGGEARRDAISAMLYRRPTVEESRTLPAEEFTRLRRSYPVVGEGIPGTIWMPLGRTDWAVGASWSDLLMPEQEEATRASMAEDRRWMMTLWSLAAQPAITDVVDYRPPRPVRRRAERAGQGSDVRVVNLHRSVREASGMSRQATDGTGRHFSVRFPVSGHWRNQAWGPGRKSHRLIYIAPFIKGPEGAPLKEGATVHVLRDRGEAR